MSDGEVWVDTPDDFPAYQDAFEWAPVEVTILTEADVAAMERVARRGVNYTEFDRSAYED